ncbi:MAG: DUF4097 domain-containing protein [Micrococcales bacterium]|nr:DUF4097 domain-containing protein [Micrococcales bacterium]
MSTPPTPSTPDPHHDSHRAFSDTSSGREASPAPLTPGGMPYAAVPASRRQARSTRRSWLIAGTGAALVLVGTGSWGIVSGSGPWTSVTQHETYRQPVETLSVTGGSGDVTISGSAPAGTVEITRRLRRGLTGSEPVSQESWTGTTLEITPDCPGSFLSGCSIDYDIEVPDATAVTVDVESGDINLGGELAKVSATSGSGDIALGGELAKVSATSGSGDIEANALGTADLFARSGSGDLDLDLVAAPTQATLKTGSGDVNVQVPRGGSYAVEAQTGSGDKEVLVDQATTSSHTISAESGSGDVTVTYR